MGDFYADQTSVVEIEFPDDGVTVWMRKYLDAGIKEEIKTQMFKLEIDDTPGDPDAKSEASQEARLNMGDFLVLQRMITRIDVPAGKQAPFCNPVSKRFLGSLRPEVISRLAAVVNEHNPLAPGEPETDSLTVALATSAGDTGG